MIVRTWKEEANEAKCKPITKVFIGANRPNINSAVWIELSSDGSVQAELNFATGEEFAAFAKAVADAYARLEAKKIPSTLFSTAVRVE